MNNQKMILKSNIIKLNSKFRGMIGFGKKYSAMIKLKKLNNKNEIKNNRIFVNKD